MTARPWAFGVVAVYGVAWICLDAKSFNWQGIAALATWMMTLLIQRAEHRDTQAIHAKLDELIHAHGGVSNTLTKLDDQEPEVI
jgi:low affinity Fe/Cu permease